MQQLKRIDFFKNNLGQGGVLQVFTEELCQALERLGIKTRIIDTLSMSHGELLALLIQDMPDCTAGFNAMVGPSSAIAPLDIPHLSLIVDSAPYYMAVRDRPLTIAAFAGEDSCQFMSLAGQKELLFFPHAIDARYFDKSYRKKVEESKRDVPCVLAGSYIDWEKECANWQEWFSKKVNTILHDIAEEVLTSPKTSHLELFLKALQTKSILSEEMQQRGVPLHDLLNSLERYIRGQDRVRMVASIDDVAVHIYGPATDRWQALNKKNLIFHPPIPYQELPSLFLRAKFVLNSIPTIKCGYHERLFLALACGATVIGSANCFAERDFSNKKAYIGVLSPEYEAANRYMREALQDETARLEAVLNTHQTILAHHTWDVRAKKLQSELPNYLERLQMEKKEG